MNQALWWTIIQSMGNEFESFGFYLSDGTSIVTKSNFNPDHASLSEALKVVRTTLNIKYPQIGMLNDPQFGGSMLSTCTFVFPIGKEPSSPWIVCRSKAIKHPAFKKLWSEESLKLPPLPLPEDPSEQLIFLKSISDHPMAPVFWKRELPQTVQLIDGFRMQWSKLYSKLWSKSVGEELKADSSKKIQQQFESASNLEIKYQKKLNQNTVIKITAHLENSVLLVDFSGSSQTDFGFPAVWTQGIVLAVANQFLGLQKPEFVFGSWLPKIHIVAPSQSITNQKAPAGSQAQWLNLNSALTNALLETLNKVFTQKKARVSNSQAVIQLQSSSVAETMIFTPYEFKNELMTLVEMIECVQNESGKVKRSFQIKSDCKLNIWTLCESENEYEFFVNSKKIETAQIPFLLKQNDIISFE